MNSKIWPFVLFLILVGCTAAQKKVIGSAADGLDAAALLAMAANPLIGIGMNLGAAILRLVAANLPLKEELKSGNSDA